MLQPQPELLLQPRYLSISKQKSFRISLETGPLERSPAHLLQKLDQMKRLPFSQKDHEASAPEPCPSVHRRATTRYLTSSLRARRSHHLSITLAFLLLFHLEQQSAVNVR
jgi:hypothetical protein